MWHSYSRKGAKSRYGKCTVDAYLYQPKLELCDLESDPHETNNLAEKKKYQDTVNEIWKKMKTFQKRTGDPWILKCEYE